MNLPLFFLFLQLLHYTLIFSQAWNYFIKSSTGLNMYIKQILPIYHQYSTNNPLIIQVVPPIPQQVPPIFQLVPPIVQQVDTNNTTIQPNTSCRWFSPLIHQLFALLHACPSNPHWEILIFALLPLLIYNWTLYTELHDVYYNNYTYKKIDQSKVTT